MKGWLKLLVLGAIPILAVTMVVDQGLAADKGSQLIFQSYTGHTNYISVVNAHDGNAVTLLIQYYNNAYGVGSLLPESGPQRIQRSGRPV